MRVAVLHHVTWSINSICDAFGDTPFQTRDQSRNVWPLALLAKPYSSSRRTLARAI